MHFDKRKSGIALINDLPWGSHFCQFYQTTQDLLDLLVPYFRTGLENNELCVWVTSEPLAAGDARKALEKGVPHFEDYNRKGQVEILPLSLWHARGGKSGKSVVARVDKAVSGGFDGLRLACNASPDKEGGKNFATQVDVVSRHNVIAAFTYPRDEFSAVGLMEVVKSHHFALVRNAGRWEVIESTEARTIKDALKRSEEKLQSLFSNMSEGFAYHRIVLDPRGKPCDYVFLEVNSAFERLTGLKGTGIVGKRVTEVLLPGIEQDPTDWIEKFGNVALTGNPVHFESYSKALGNWYSVSAFSPHKGYFAVTLSDITERKRAEESLLRAKEEWERTFDSVPDMIAIINNQHRIMRVNKAMARRLGLKQEECVGLPCYRYMHGLAEPPSFCPHSRTICDGKQHLEEIHEENIGGDFLVSTTPLYDKQGQLIGSVHVAHDITETKKAERRITSLNEQLQRKIDELSIANKELEAFSYSVSHDLRAPLRSIDGFSQEILEDYGEKLDENGKDSLRRIRAASRRMDLLIDGLLNLSRLSRSEIVHREVDLSGLALHIAGDLRKSQPGREVEVVISEGMVDYGDERLLYVLLQNLLGNAWKFTGRVAKGRIEFGLVRIGGEAAYVVRDNGAGFDMAYADKLFKPFQRLHEASDFSGTGIGLATVQRIIHRHGGRVWAEGVKGEGAAFYFTLK